MLIQKNMEFKGFWYKPKESDNKIAGILKVNPFKSNDLELIGGFSNHPFDNFKSETEEVLWGEVYDSNNHLRKITLFQCFSSGSVNFSANFPIIRFRCSIFIDGIHIESIAKKWNGKQVALDNTEKIFVIPGRESPDGKIR